MSKCLFVRVVTWRSCLGVVVVSMGLLIGVPELLVFVIVRSVL